MEMSQGFHVKTSDVGKCQVNDRQKHLWSIHQSITDTCEDQQSSVQSRPSVTTWVWTADVPGGAVSSLKLPVCD